VSSWSADQVRKFLDQKSPQEYNLVDVRTPEEYKPEHLPGAQLIPVAELETRWKELDRDKPTIVY